ncbi:prohibitin family protein [Cellulomonas alba]|uniref:Prohibitin family protein n=1 Tax=Cellulomonas alba TaxID=3053467 RepID=A0ABT7SEE5_9CELL|nr:prohibitin family protein [Cellulomonas alba]MDM7854538.1 prohibitin family protein [Cellulomonas alba]
MGSVVLIVLLLVAGVGVLVGGRKATGQNRWYVRGAGTALLVLAASVLVAASYYSQDAGEARVLRSFTGQLVGQTTTQGAHWKAPWVSAINYDIRNNTVTYIGDGKQGDHSGGSATGEQITFQDKDGVTGNLDVVVRYSIRGEAVLEIYKEFKTQESFVSKVVTNDVRSIARNIPAGYSTIEVYNNRAKLEADIQQALEDRWAENGLVVDRVTLQEIRYSDDVKQRFDDAQAARIAVEKAEAEQQQAAVEAATKKIEAQGTADANAVLSKSLTPQVLQQRYIDALTKASTVYVVPQGSTPMVGVGPGALTAPAPATTSGAK